MGNWDYNLVRCEEEDTFEMIPRSMMGVGNRRSEEGDGMGEVLRYTLYK